MDNWASNNPDNVATMLIVKFLSIEEQSFLNEQPTTVGRKWALSTITKELHIVRSQDV